MPLKGKVIGIDKQAMIANFFNDKYQIKRLLAKNYSGGRVLEIGAGRGENRPVFNSYVGIDLPGSPYLKEGKIDLYCDGRFLAFPKEKFDFAFIVAALYLIPNPDFVIQQVWSVLKPGSKFMIFDYTERTITSSRRKAQELRVNSNYTIWNEKELRKRLQNSSFFQIKRKYHRGLIYHTIKRVLGMDPRWLILIGKKNNESNS